MAKNKMTTWAKLDNAGKIFPPTTTKRDTKVFRFSCELYQPVDQAKLQAALDKTILSYPIFLSILKKGMFWYYLESTTIRPIVRLEYKPPCSMLYIHNKKSLLFEVTYYQKRISVEIYHSLTDGTGAMMFLKTLVTNYLLKMYPQKLNPDEMMFAPDGSHSQKMDDSFKKYYSPNSKSNSKTSSSGGSKNPHIDKRIISHVIKTPMLSENRLSVIEGTMPLDLALKLAKSKNVSLTVLLTALFLCATNDTMSVHDKRRPVVAVVPVNLRNYFASDSVRNFFGVINVGYDFKNCDPSLDAVVASVAASFKRELTVERLTARMNMLSSLENNVFARPVPLIIKDVIMSIANTLSDKEKTISISNIGKIDMPEQLREYIRLFDVFVSTKIIQICICSYGNNLDIGFSSAYVSTDIQKYFFRYLTENGIPVEINTNSSYDE